MLIEGLFRCSGELPTGVLRGWFQAKSLTRWREFVGRSQEELRGMNNHVGDLKGLKYAERMSGGFWR